jgi:hypothetical protein
MKNNKVISLGGQKIFQLIRISQLLLLELRSFVRPGDSFLAVKDIPMLNYLTHTSLSIKFLDGYYRYR